MVSTAFITFFAQSSSFLLLRLHNLIFSSAHHHPHKMNIEIVVGPDSARENLNPNAISNPEARCMNEKNIIN